jgi:hypothetical protein
MLLSNLHSMGRWDSRYDSDNVAIVCCERI